MTDRKIAKQQAFERLNPLIHRPSIGAVMSEIAAEAGVTVRTVEKWMQELRQSPKVKGTPEPSAPNAFTTGDDSVQQGNVTPRRSA